MPATDVSPTRDRCSTAPRPSSPPSPLLIDLARVAYKLRDVKGALGYLAHARSLEPQNAGVHFLFGIVCVELNLGAEAYDSMKKAVELDPENPLVNYAMGAVATHRHEPSESIPYFEKYVRLKPDDPRGRFALGAAGFYSGQLDEARKDLELGGPLDRDRRRRALTSSDASHARSTISTPRRREIEPGTPARTRTTPMPGRSCGLDRRCARSSGRRRSRLFRRHWRSTPSNYEATLNLAALYGRTGDPRADRAGSSAGGAASRSMTRGAAQEFLRIIEVVP